jgi:hypothetical protein
VWAVGYTDKTPQTPLIGHWNGTDWAQFPQPDLIYTDLNGVEAISPSDAWAVGEHFTLDERISIAVIQHWDGVRWTLMRLPPPPGGGAGRLYAVSAVSSTDMWAIGHYTEFDGFVHGLAMHWDGYSWIPIPMEKTEYGELFEGVVALSSDDVWAVGNKGTRSTELVPAVEHWDGAAWTEVAVARSDVRSQFYGVSGVSSDDVWAVGGLSHNGSPLVQHWDGIRWSDVPVHAPGDLQLVMYDVAAIASDNVWAAGGAYNESTVAQRWDGTRWRGTAPFSAPASQFSGVTALSPTDIWAVGWYVDGDVTPLIEHSNGAC